MSLPCSIIGFGAVGKTLYRVVRERKLPVSELRVYARSARTEVLDGETVEVLPLDESAFTPGGVALFAGTEGLGNVSEVWAPKAVEAGCTVIDNSSTFRMVPEVPLVVPEVNPHHLSPDKRLIANPNCSTIQMVVALAPLHRAVGVKRVVVSTYQSVSGAGAYGMEVLEREARLALDGAPARIEDSPFVNPIAFNCIPWIGTADDTGYTGEERKMMDETRKILDDDAIAVSATTVRVGVSVSHAECVNVELRAPLSAEEARRLLEEAPGVVVVDDPAESRAPTPLDCADRDEVFVGRIRRDLSVPAGLDLWVVADNVRKGAATNAVQIAEALIERGMLG